MILPEDARFLSLISPPHTLGGEYRYMLPADALLIG